MTYNKSKIKVLPIKLADALYQDLKYVAEKQHTSMAEIVRKHIEPVQETAENLRKKHQQKSKPKDIFEDLKHLIYTGPLYEADKTDDEILYGGKLGEY